MSEYAALIVKVKEAFAVYSNGLGRQLIDSLIAAVEDLSRDLAAARHRIADLYKERDQAREMADDACNAVDVARREKEAMRERTIEECLQAALVPLTDEQIEQLDHGLGTIYPGSWHCKLVQKSIVARLAALSAQPDPHKEESKPERNCTCHPDDNPPRPCPQKFAYSECVKAASERNDQRMKRIAKAFGVGPLAAKDAGSGK